MGVVSNLPKVAKSGNSEALGIFAIASLWVEQTFRLN